MRGLVVLLLTSLYFLVFPLSGRGEKLLFTPLPLQPKETLIADYNPLVDYLQRKTGLPIEFHYERDYNFLLKDLKDGKIHIIVAGPLPYHKLKKEFPQAKAIVHFKEADGSVSYSCVLITAFDGPRSVKEVKGPIALTQKLSTCGYFSANIMLSKHGKNIHKMGYAFFDTHDHVVQAVLKGVYEVGSVRKDIAEKYKGFNLRILEESPKWPSFSIVVNQKALSEEKINKIKRALLEISPEEAKGLVAGRYGFAEVNERDFEIIKKYERYFPTF